MNTASTESPFKSTWQREFCLALSAENIDCTYHFDGIYALITLENKQISISLIDINNKFSPSTLSAYQNDFHQKGNKLIYIWEDVWHTKQTQVLARINSLLGLNQGIHGRKTKVMKLEKPVADAFLNRYHLQGSVNSRHKFGLILNDEVIAVATFSALRKMNHTPNYKSAELIRFAVKAGFSVTGGLSKLIQAFRQLLKSNDLMTYADKDWSLGEAYIKLGFVHTADLESQYFGLDSHYNRLLKKDNSVPSEKEVFNTGSLKYILKF